MAERAVTRERQSFNDATARLQKDHKNVADLLAAKDCQIAEVLQAAKSDGFEGANSGSAETPPSCKQSSTRTLIVRVLGLKRLLCISSVGNGGSGIR